MTTLTRRLIVHRFVAEQNIQHFKALLSHELDEARRETLRRMIREEEAKLQSDGSREPPPSGRDA